MDDGTGRRGMTKLERRRGRPHPLAGAALAVFLLVAIAVASACAPSSARPPEGSSDPEPLDRGGTAPTTPYDGGGRPDVARRTQVAVLDPAALAALEPKGFALGPLVDGSKAATTQELSRSSLGVVLQTLTADVRKTLSEHPTARVSSVSGTRLFEVAWLRSPEMRFELAGVFNRIDRRAFYEGTCGEVRFLYRLAYTTQQAGAAMHGRLPLTLNVVFLVPGEAGCEDQAKAWRPPADLDETRAAAWLAEEGALAPARRARWTLKAVEANLQTVRVQSTAHPSMGGHSEYSLRVFHPSSTTPRTFAPAPMENLPDVARLDRDPALRAELVAYLRDPAVLRGIDGGVVRVPDRFLADGARSISPRGLGRSTNRPFSQVVREADLEGLDLAGYRTIRSPRSLLRRLDGLSCSGCHQSGTIAGFHHVGLDPKDAPAWSSMVSGSSAHLRADLERRRAYVEAIASGATPDETRPSAERQGHEGTFGAPCGLGDPGFAAWTCQKGLRCERMEDADVGMCVDDAHVGAPCEIGDHVYDGATPVGDRVTALARRTCGGSHGCSPNINGFPLGACASKCDPKEDAGACIDFIDIDGFQACLRVGVAPDECAERYHVERVDRACDVDHPCRQDFVCARTTDAAHGACVPPYFVFPLRLDGYPLRK